MNRNLGLLGLVLTVAYVAVLIWLVGDGLDRLPVMPLGEAFLAGAFGPVAILWLVLGFFQQGRELQLNTEALRLQARELRSSVEQQRHVAEQHRELVALTRQQVHAETEKFVYERRLHQSKAQPRFAFGTVSGATSETEVRYSATVRNVGATATGIMIVFTPPLRSSTPEELGAWATGEEHRMEWTCPTKLATATSTITIRYTDADGLPGHASFQLLPNRRDPNKVPDVLRK